MTKRIVVAIDGPAGAGKSTIARRVAATVGLSSTSTRRHVPGGGACGRSGRAWTWPTRTGWSNWPRRPSIQFEPGGSRVLLNGEDVTEAIRAPEMSQAASRVSAVGGVRRAWWPSSARMGAESSRGDGGPGHRHGGFPRCRGEDFPGRRPGRAGRAPRAGAARRRARRRAGEVAREIRQRDERDRGARRCAAAAGARRSLPGFDRR